MRQTYRALAGLVALGVVVQAAAIAYAWFTAIVDVDSGLVIDESYEGNAGHALHGIVGMYVLPVLGLALLVVSFLAARDVPGARTWGAAVFLAIVLQVVLAFVSFGVPAIGALHGINALVVLGLAIRAVSITRPAVRTAAPVAPGTSAQSGSSLPV